MHGDWLKPEGSWVHNNTITAPCIPIEFLWNSWEMFHWFTTVGQLCSLVICSNLLIRKYAAHSRPLTLLFGSLSGQLLITITFSMNQNQPDVRQYQQY